MIPVTQPFCPPFAEYASLLKRLWESKRLTNHGPLVQELESKLSEYLGVKRLLFVSSGTSALQIAIKALDLKGEVITTPFSYVATTSSIVWEGCHPVFVDIDPSSMNIDVSKIEAAINPRTSAILATHIYGNPCDIDSINTIATRHRLKVIYDAAHGFGTLYKGRSVFTYGDVSIASFHATKLFHTVEGGALFSNDSDLLEKMSLMRHFGQQTPESFPVVGLNAKNSELHAAMGLANLPYVEDILAKHKSLSLQYDLKLDGLRIRKPSINPQSEYNYAYYPVVFATEKELKKKVEVLNQNDVFPKRYFYPSLASLSYLEKSSSPVCEDLCRKVLCLPLYFDLAEEEVDFICGLLLEEEVFFSK